VEATQKAEVALTAPRVVSTHHQAERRKVMHTKHYANNEFPLAFLNTIIFWGG
jgi:hypothetical protein